MVAHKVMPRVQPAELQVYTVNYVCRLIGVVERIEAGVIPTVLHIPVLPATKLSQKNGKFMIKRTLLIGLLKKEFIWKSLIPYSILMPA